MYQPLTGQHCSCKPGVHRDNCPNCEGTGWLIDFAAIRARHKSVPHDNARLIAAAPELLEALRGMVKLIDHLHEYPKANARKFFFLRDGGEHGYIHEARAAIAKATGE